MISNSQLSLQTRAACALLSLILAALPLNNAYSGDGGDDDNDQNFNQVAGVEIDAAGVLRVREFSPELLRQQIAAARQQLPADLARRSPLRKISLRRLEDAVAAKLEAGEKVPEDMLALAGLTGVEYVFFYPEQGEIVLAGPAEGFVKDPSGRVRGIDTGRPVVLLEDLVVALRAFPPHEKSNSVISVSIDPTEQGLQQMQQFLASVRGRVRPSDAARLAAGLKGSMGMQNVTFQGVSTSTHFAQVLVEADYRMKLVGIGLEKLPVGLLSYVDRVHPRQVAANAMERWYFVPNYDCVRVSEDENAMQLIGKGVKLIGEGERVGQGGQREASRGVNKASQAYCAEFTEKFEEISRTVVVYAQLRNLIDVSVAAAFIQKQDFYGKSGWEMPVFGSEKAFAVETHTAPVQVETAVNAIWRGNTLMTPLGGGVKLQPRVALNRDRILPDSEGRAAQAHQSQRTDSLKPGQWWWD
ncbi:hypothetical protein Poly24_12960 [Rosistilla carotiformis]|uniref:DUF1598 domain-containing protein n=1 Tax=Rosistilla carotiformis TaxID=2528017 RepID=A0A518JPX2_9BACT|nr:DUF1598 domain-containing protein [Rosistilla carotiformis]QDV67595.1 hypothetical protein Poly24_12960 [Rosistilla carotiformis]